MNALRQIWNWTKHHWTWLKWFVGLALLTFLFVQNWESFERLSERRVGWGFFLSAFLLCGGSILLTFVRWYLLVWAQEFPFRLRDAFRLGFVGYLFNYVGPGAVGGDVYKAGMIAAEQTSRRTVAVATILLDRVLGMLALFLVAAGVSFIQTTPNDSTTMQLCVQIFRAGSIVGLVGWAAMLLPAFSNNRAVRSLTRLPVVGDTVGNLLNGLVLYQSKPLVLIAAVVISLVGHFGMLSSFYCCALALNPADAVPDYMAHLLFIPAAELAGMIPIVPGGVGALEGAVGFFYTLAGAAFGDGYLTGIGYRVITVVVATIGAGYYFASRKEIDRALEDSDGSAETDDNPRSAVREYRTVDQHAV